MKKQIQQVSDFHIQSCQCGGINVCFGNVTVHMEKIEFMAMVEKINKAKANLFSKQPKIVHEEHHEIH